MLRISRCGAACVALLLSLVGALAARADTVVDLELVLAVDVSLSMDLEEQRLQRDGYVAALRDPNVLSAIQSGPHGRIAISYVEWAGPFSQATVLPWTIVDGKETAEQVAALLAEAPISRRRMTSISSALTYAGKQLESSPYEGIRRVIDMSGDGPNNSGAPVEPIRDELVGSGVVINGLPVIIRPSQSSFFDINFLDRYYADCVIGGPGAFMIPIRDKSEFATATRQKLLLEISGFEPPPRLIPAQLRSEEEKTDCLIGEQLWRRYMDDRIRQ
ncbi:MAG: DUF1194 domain-containing protein [Hyphomicrobiaceae bacterium]|nr:DUF1194 domain-containing protein [Hyphomicrobiaceae bacterium]